MLLAGLDNPAGVAVQPKTGDVFVSDSAAGRCCADAGRRARPPPRSSLGFPQDIYGKGPKYAIGPLGPALRAISTILWPRGGVAIVNMGE